MENELRLTGHLGEDPQKKELESGNQVVNFSLETSEKYKDKEGVTQEKTLWHKIVIWGKLGDVAMNYLKKGSRATFKGKLDYDKWTDDKGSNRVTAKMIVEKLVLLDTVKKNSVFLRLKDKPDHYIHLHSENKKEFVYVVKRGVVGACIWEKEKGLEFIKEEGLSNVEIIDVRSILKEDGGSN